MKLFHALALLACTFSLPSCFVARTAVNEPLDIAAVRSLVPGETTAKEAVERLGAPSDVVQLGKRFAYRYDHTINKRAGLFLIVIALFNEDARQDRTWLFFDEKSVLTHVGSTFSSHRPQYAVPWEDIHEDSDNLSRDNERKGLRERESKK